MSLTTEQLDLISKEIIQGGIKYQDLYEELLDHYILAIENRAVQGQTFEQAFGEVHTDFVNYRRPPRAWDHYGVWKDYTNGGKPEYGLGKLQVEYEETLTKEISKRHWQIMKNYFRWPTIITTLLVGLLTFQFAYLVPPKACIWIIFACAFFPLVLILPESIRNLKQYLLKNRMFANSLKTNAVSGRLLFSITLFSCVLNVINVSNRFFDYELLKHNPFPITAGLSCFYIAYSLSFYQLYRERFKVNMA
ncbi:hypothetical protein [Runella sp.]|uniref:hypothetical protein n=1 Tax=Runella sp. TaxID=1960881 RepID=UPI003D0AF711